MISRKIEKNGEKGTFFNVFLHTFTAPVDLLIAIVFIEFNIDSEIESQQATMPPPNNVHAYIHMNQCQTGVQCTQTAPSLCPPRSLWVHMDPITTPVDGHKHSNRL